MSSTHSSFPKGNDKLLIHFKIQYCQYCTLLFGIVQCTVQCPAVTLSGLTTAPSILKIRDFPVHTLLVLLAGDKILVVVVLLSSWYDGSLVVVCHGHDLVVPQHLLWVVRWLIRCRRVVWIKSVLFCHLEVSLIAVILGKCKIGAVLLLLGRLVPRLWVFVLWCWHELLHLSLQAVWSS